MSKKASRVDELVELLKDEKIAEVLVARLEELIERKLDKIIEKVLLKLNPIVEAMVATSVAAQQEVLQKKLNDLETENNKLKTRLDIVETEGRATNLMIHGLPEENVDSGSKEAVSEATQATLRMCNSTLGLAVHEADIAMAFRLPKRGKEKHRPILVKFNSIKTRKMVYGSRSLLKKTPVFINEHLTPNNAHLYAIARGLVKEGKAISTWTAGGITYIKWVEDPNCKPMRITSSVDLDKKIASLSLSLDGTAT